MKCFLLALSFAICGGAARNEYKQKLGFLAGLRPNYDFLLEGLEDFRGSLFGLINWGEVMD